MKQPGKGDNKERSMYHICLFLMVFLIASYHIALMIVKIASTISSAEALNKSKLAQLFIIYNRISFKKIIFPSFLSRSGQNPGNYVSFFDCMYKNRSIKVLTFYIVYAKLNITRNKI